MVNISFLLLLFIPSFLIAGRKSRPEELKEELEKTYKKIEVEYAKDEDQQIDILKKAATPHLEALFKDKLETETYPSDQKTAFLTYLLGKHYNEEMLEKIGTKFKGELEQQSTDYKTALLTYLLDEHYKQEMLEKIGTKFQDELKEQPADYKTALLIHLLDEHYNSLNKDERLAKIETLFKDELKEQPADYKTALLIYLLDEHYNSLEKEKITPEIANLFHQDYKIMDKEKKLEILKDLLRPYSEEDRQKIINELMEIRTNATMLKSPFSCEDVVKNGNPTHVGLTPLFDELNNAHFVGFFNPTMKNLILNRNQFNEFNSFNQWGLWIQPFGFFTQFNQNEDPLKFNFYTVGLTLGGDYTFFERLVLGLGLAYSHSEFSFEKKNRDASLNSVYVGPSLSYIFPNGYLSCTLYGVANFYHISRKVSLFKEVKEKLSEIDYTNWDLVARLEGGLSYPIGWEFYIQPTGRLDYLHVFQPSSTEQLEDDVEITAKSLNASFLTSKLGVSFTREFYDKTHGFLIPSLSAGCYFFNPLKNEPYHYEISECKTTSKSLKIKGWQQYFIGAGLSYLHKKGILVSINYEYALGAIAPTQEGDIRVELSW